MNTTMTLCKLDKNENEIFVEAEIEFYIENHSFDHEFGTQTYPSEVVIDSVKVGGREVPEEDLKESFATNYEEIAISVEDELKEQEKP